MKDDEMERARDGSAVPADRKLDRDAQPADLHPNAAAVNHTAGIPLPAGADLIDGVAVQVDPGNREHVASPAVGDRNTYSQVGAGQHVLCATKVTGDAERAREAVTDAIRKADEDFGYSIRLTRLVDDVATYTLTLSDEEPLAFDSNEDANEYVRAERDKRRADAVLLAFAQQPEGWREALLSAQHAFDLIARPSSTTRGLKDLAREESKRLSAMLDVAPIPGEE